MTKGPSSFRFWHKVGMAILSMRCYLLVILPCLSSGGRLGLWDLEAAIGSHGHQQALLVRNAHDQVGALHLGAGGAELLRTEAARVGAIGAGEVVTRGSSLPPAGWVPCSQRWRPSRILVGLSNEGNTIWIPRPPDVGVRQEPRHPSHYSS